VKTTTVLSLALLMAPLSSIADEPPAESQPPSESQDAEIRAAVASYVEAFNKHDAVALAAHWSPEAVYISRSSGERITGREAMEQEFAAIFEQRPDVRLEAKSVAVQAISPNIAVEHGTARVLRGDSEPEETNYTAVYMKRDGKWLLDRISEEAVVVNSRYERLKELQWLIGDWIDGDGEGAIRIECNWTANNNYITRRYTVSRDGEIQSSGLQIIGWDPKGQSIRSWLFDSDGGFVSGTWTNKNDHWYVQSTATLADGGSGSFTSVFQPIDGDSYTWQKINQIVDGQLLPNLDEVVVTRQ